MIQIEKIEIVEFRGIRNLTLDLKRKSFGIAGPNGTGKSGVVDAIEFALTGNITRLAGAGTAELSVKLHAPHVDSSKEPENSLVRVTAFAPSIGKCFIIERSVKGASAPSDTKSKAVLAIDVYYWHNADVPQQWMRDRGLGQRNCITFGLRF